MSLRFENIILKASDFGENNPMPDLKNVSYIHAKCETTENVTAEDKKHFGKGAIDTLLPYLSQDGYNREIKDTEFEAAILENDFLRATFLPQLGGRLWSLYHKKLERELLYVNDIVQPANLALRNAWVAGGVEWNIGIKGHSPFTCASMFTAQSKNSNGEDILTMYEYERIRRVVYGINAYLDGDKLYIRTTVENRSDRTPYMYWWSNIAVPEKNVRVLTEADEMFTCIYEDNHYLIDKVKAPYFAGEDLSYPERAPHAGDVFFIIPDEKRKWIASVEDDGIGLLQYSTPELKGRKEFFWGNGKGGKNWNNFLTGCDKKYIEIQAGLMRTQQEHIPMPANSCWSWTECYTAAQIDPEILSKDWKEACAVMSETVNAMPDPKLADIPLKSKKAIRSLGSGWGALEDGQISDFYEFPQSSISPEQTDWIFLKENGYLAEANIDTPPVSYQITPETLLMLENSLNNPLADHWYTYLHLGIVRYALDNIEGARQAWEKSLEKKQSAWAYRNLSMLYMNVLNDKEKAVNYAKKAAELNTILCRGLLADVAKVFTECGASNEWIALYKTLPASLKENGRLKLYSAIAYINCGNDVEAKKLINQNFLMSDIKEGELSISAVWSKLYGDAVPLPERLNFMMYEI